MRYVSTRGQAPALSFDDVLLAGLARDGGLYVPEAWPRLEADGIADLAGVPYAEAAARVIRPFLAGSLAEGALDALCREAYGRFARAGVAPLKQLDERIWLMELFHGPTLAFKDMALQLLGGLFDRVLARRDERITVVGATSGDTGSAAIEACRGRERVDVFILHPKGRVSEVQRRQMTTVEADNVYNLAIEGTFDDCQALVKAMFADAAFRDETGLAAVNSINWARIAAQIAYYVVAAVALGAPQREVAFAVPTGNFGNVYAGYAARRMGLPVAQLIVGSNRNDILTRFFETGEMRVREVHPTLSPSMDIQVSSNFERLLCDVEAGNGEAVSRRMRAFREQGAFALPAETMAALREVFDGYRLDDEGTLAAIARIHRETGELVDPHTAVGVEAARAKAHERRVPVVALATAHPAKFPDAVERATGLRPALPERLADLYERPERYHVLPAAVADVQDYVRRHRRAANPQHTETA